MWKSSEEKRKWNHHSVVVSSGQPSEFTQSKLLMSIYRLYRRGRSKIKWRLSNPHLLKREWRSELLHTDEPQCVRYRMDFNAEKYTSGYNILTQLMWICVKTGLSVNRGKNKRPGASGCSSAAAGSASSCFSAVATQSSAERTRAGIWPNMTEEKKCSNTIWVNLVLLFSTDSELRIVHIHLWARLQCTTCAGKCASLVQRMYHRDALNALTESMHEVVLPTKTAQNVLMWIRGCYYIKAFENTKK